MNRPAVLNLTEVSAPDVALAGGKGAKLGDMLGRGLPVPPGFVIPAWICRDFFHNLELTSEISELPQTPAGHLDERCAALRHRITGAPFPLRPATAIMAAQAAESALWKREFTWAVRSSATAEDLAAASFAGQHATYYYVAGNRLLEMVKHCWASLWTPEAVAYRRTHGIDASGVWMAVVVQEMIPADVSGVTFSANPLTGSTSEIVTESSWGLGAAIVDGRVTPDRYVVMRQGLELIERRIAEKRCMVPPTPPTKGRTRLLEVPRGMRRQATLSPRSVRQIVRLALDAENHYGQPQDMEWAMAGERIYVLQSRAITVMGPAAIDHGIKGEYVLFKPLAENFSQPLTPLSADIWNRGLPPGIRLIRGWVYLSLQAFRPLLPFKLSNPQVANLLYLNPGAAPPALRLSWGRLPAFIIMLWIYTLVYAVVYARTRRMPDDFMDGYRRLCRQVCRDATMGPLETFFRLLSWSKFLDPIGHMVMPVNFSAVRYFGLLGVLKLLMRRWLPDVDPKAVALLTSGTAGMLSVQMGHEVWDLARVARAHPQVSRVLREQTADGALVALRTEPSAGPFLDRLDRFLARHGHRGIGELEFQSVRWEENPATILGMVRNYLDIDADPTRGEKATARARRRFQAEIKERLGRYVLERPLGWRWRLMRYVARRTRYFAKLRENSRFYHIMGFTAVRRKILATEDQLLRRGSLKCRDDIFFLRWHEVDALQSGALAWSDVETRIHSRRMTHLRLSRSAPPRTIGIDAPIPCPAEDTASNILRGQSASPGIYRGIAHVILDPGDDIDLKPGEILVAPYTDPAWTPLFLTAGAAVVEVGSYLSHAGTVAREYGLPCVVDVRDCTQRIQSGSRIEVDGHRGRVRLESNGEGTSS